MNLPKGEVQISLLSERTSGIIFSLPDRLYSTLLFSSLFKDLKKRNASI